MSREYVLNIRVGQEYYPVNYYEGKVSWNRRVKPDMIFSEKDKEIITEEMYEAGHKTLDFRFEPYLTEVKK